MTDGQVRLGLQDSKASVPDSTWGEKTGQFNHIIEKGAEGKRRNILGLALDASMKDQEYPITTDGEQSLLSANARHDSDKYGGNICAMFVGA